VKRTAHDLVSVKANLPGKLSQCPLGRRRPEPKPSNGSILDHHHDARLVRALDAEASVKRTAHDLVSMKANLPGKLSQCHLERGRPKPKPSNGSILDHHNDARVVRALDAEVALTR
jgi:hypothetical protein